MHPKTRRTMGDVRLEDKADSFNPDELESEEQALELADKNTQLAKPGEIRFTGHLKRPYLQIAHGVGGLAQAGFSPGELVIDKTVVVYSPPKLVKGAAQESPPAVVTIVSVYDYWKEVTAFGSPDLPRTWPSEAAAEADGMVTKYPPFGSGLPLPNARPALNIDLLVKEPEGVEDRGTFLFALDGAHWAPARFICDKAMYTEVITPLTKAVYTHGASGIFSATFELTTRNKLIKKTGNFTWVPCLKLAGTKTPKQIDELKAVMGNL